MWFGWRSHCPAASFSGTVPHVFEKTPCRCPETDADGDGWVGMLVHGPVRGMGPAKRLVSNAAAKRHFVVQRVANSVADFANLFVSHVGGGVNERANICCELVGVGADGVSFGMNVHEWRVLLFRFRSQYSEGRAGLPWGIALPGGLTLRE